MFEISEQLIVGQSVEIFGVSRISWESSPCKQLSPVNDEDVISLSHRKVYVFSDSVLCLGKVNQNPISNTAWERHLDWFKDSSQYRILDTIDREPMEFEWNIFPGFTTLQFVQDVKKFMNKMGEPEQFQGQIVFMSMFNDIIWWIKDNEKKFSTLVSLLAKRFPAGRCSFLGPGTETKWAFYLHGKTRRRMGQSRWIDDDQIRRKRTPSFPSQESIVPRNAQKQRSWKIINTLLCRWRYDWNCFSHNHVC